MPGRAQRPLGGGGRAGPAGQRRAQGLAPLGERRVDARRRPAARGPRSAGGSRGGRRRPGRSRRWAPARTPCARHRAGAPHRRRTRRPSPTARRRPARRGRRPAARRPRPAPSPGPCRSVGKRSSKVQQDGHRDVVRQVRDQRGRRRARQPCSAAARPAVTTVEPVGARPGARSATVAGSAAASAGSISTATTRGRRVSSASVSEPRPGPTSRTTSRGVEPPRPGRSAAPCWRRCTKFWPSDLVGETPRACASRADLRRPEQALGRRRVHPAQGVTSDGSSVEQVAARRPH